MARQIFITESERQKLQELISETKEFGKGNKTYLKSLEQELELAQEVITDHIPPDVITMNSKVLLKDLTSGEDMVFTLVYPMDADYKLDKISILAPVGTAILGFRKGDIIDWNVPDGVVKLQVVDILYQPEAAGDLD